MKILSALFAANLILVALTSHAVTAATNGFVVPPFRGAPGGGAGYWENFTVPVGDPGNLPDQPESTLEAVLVQTEVSAFLTGSGNIYNMDGASTFVLEHAAPSTLGTVVLQTRTLGAELDYDSVALGWSNASGLQTLAPLPRVELNRGNAPGLGATVSSLWQWDLSELGVQSYTIAFRAAEPSLSMDSVTLDTSEEFTPLFAPRLQVDDASPSIERWMYPHNAAPCDRPAGSVFGTLGDEAGVDTRHAQLLVGWDTAGFAVTNQGPWQYLIQRCRLTLTINRGDAFVYDPTADDLRSFLDTSDAEWVADEDAGRPVELFGAGYRNGFDAASFDQCAPFGSSDAGQRNAFASSWSTNGLWVDVSNHIGKTNAAFPHFEARPFAIGHTTNAAPGELVPPGAKMTFNLDLEDPFVLAYLQEGLDAGRLRFMVSSLHTSGGPEGAASYPDFATRFNQAVLEPTRLELECVVAGEGDLDADRVPDDWEIFHLTGLTHQADEDPDLDGASVLAEWQSGTDPADDADVLRLQVRDFMGQSATLQWLHRANRGYRVEFTTDWEAWETIAEPELAYLPNGVVEWRIDQIEEAAGSPRFYRVRVDEP